MLSQSRQVIDARAVARAPARIAHGRIDGDAALQHGGADKRLREDFATDQEMSRVSRV